MGIRGAAVDVCVTDPTLPGCDDVIGSVPEPTSLALASVILLGLRRGARAGRSG